ncbi:hypothetical protein PR002_g32901, partial [Phytophthora rubi]
QHEAETESKLQGFLSYLFYRRESDLIVQTLTADLETLKQNIMQKEGQGEGAAERVEDAADGEDAVSCCHRTPHCHRSSVHWNLIQD